MPAPKSALDNAARTCLVIGAVLLLVGNLLALGGGKGTVLVLGEIAVIAGIVGMIIAWLVGSRRPRGKSQSGNHQHPGRR